MHISIPIVLTVLILLFVLNRKSGYCDPKKQICLTPPPKPPPSWSVSPPIQTSGLLFPAPKINI